MAIDFAVSVAAKIGEYLLAPIGRPLGYLIYYNNNINGLKNNIPNLENVQAGVQGLVDAADREGELILPNVKDWLTRVDRIVGESTKFFNDEVKVNKRCFNQLCPNLKSRYQVSRKAKKKRLIVERLLHYGKFDGVSYPAPPPPLWSTSVGDLEVFESRKSTFKEIMDALQDENVSIIGVYGMGGIGKTTLVKEVAMQAAEHKLFGEIVMTTVSHLPNVRKIQGDIAEMLGISLKEENELVRAARLCERLNQVKRVLVILDDLWTLLDLKAIGIPHGHVHKGCKIVLTSRNLDVCNEMNTEINFPINVLSEIDSWNLFKKMTNDTVDLPDLHPIATKVAKKCAGLPIAIVTVARALRGKSKHAWTDALRQLRNSMPRNIKGMHEKVYLSLELSYNFLENEELKSCFLLCSLFKEDIDIPVEYLVRYGMGLGLFQNVRKLEEARDRAHTLIDTLKACCLLLGGENEESIRMHDVIRDFAISVASSGEYVFLISDDTGFIEWPNNNTLNDCSVMSLLSTNIIEFPDGLKCPKLQLCLLECYSDSVKIPDNLFGPMKELKVLDMRHMPVPLIPQSFSSLRKLRTLCLEHCKLRDLSLIGEFKGLEILSLVGSDVEQLPTEIGQLTHLKLLDLTDCDKLTRIPPNVISKLFRLECLYMRNSFAHWGDESQNMRGRNATLTELKCLSCLSTLEVHIPDVKLLPKDLLFENLVRFKIFVGSYFSKRISYSYPKTLKLRLDQGITLEKGVCTLLKKAQYLILDYPILDYLEDLKNVVYDLKRENVANLKCLEVYGYNGIEYLVDTSIFAILDISILEKLKVVSMATLKQICRGDLQIRSFCKLCELRLSNLPELMYLWKDPARQACLGNLMTVSVFHCHKLKNLFSQYTARDLGRLHELHVWSCDTLTEILARDRGIAAPMDEIVLPKLNSLRLEVLPNLRSFCPEMNSSLDLNGSLDAPAQESLFNRKVIFPALEELSLRELNNVKEIWHRQLPAENFCRLRVLAVFSCNSLLTIFSSNLPQKLRNLEILSVEWCDLVEEVCELEGLSMSDVHIATTVTLPRIRVLLLGRLPRLKHLWWNKVPRGFLSLQNLNSLVIYGCDNLRYVFSLSASKGLVQFQQLEIHSCQMMKEIFASKRGEEDEDGSEKIMSPQLCYFELIDLPELTNFCQGGHTLEYPSLKVMKIENCPKMKSFTASEVDEQGNLGAIIQPFFSEKVAFPDLEELHIVGMNDLVEIWHNQLPEKTFCKLRVLDVSKCDKLLNIGLTNMLPRLMRLEALYITECGSLEEVFVAEGPVFEQDDTAVSLPSLIELRLQSLPKLRHIWWLQNSRGIRGFQSLCSLEISRCDGLNYVFSPSVARGLVQLQKLKINSCELVKEIVGEDSGETEPIGMLVLPRVHTLELENLPNVVSFCTGACAIKWLSLKELRIANCAKMRSFVSIPCQQRLRMNNEGPEGTLEGNLFSPIQPFFNEKVLFPTLEKLRIDSLQSLNELWHSELSEDSFCQLRILEVRRIDKLLKLLPSNLISRVQYLEELSVKHCDSLEMILEQGEDSGDKVVFPEVHTLRLVNLPNLQSFCRGNHGFECPSLEKVNLENCPSLQTFSSGFLITPKLNAIEVGYHELLWKGDLNSTVQHLFKVKEEHGQQGETEEEEIVTAEVIYCEISEERS